MTPSPQPLLKIENLRISFRGQPPESPAVAGISLEIYEGETHALVGESGSGKSVTALSLMRLLPEPPAVYESGRILFDGKDILSLDKKSLRAMRGKGIAYIFQEPSAALNPVFQIGFQIEEALRLHRHEIKDFAAETARLLALVGIPDPAARMKSYPHQLSGGMQQRAMIAMALACQPRLLVADEPTTALDVTIQKQIMDLMADLKKRLDMTVLLITHNFGIVSGFADRVSVMFRGRIVESGETRQILESPQHPYTRSLIACVPRLGARRKRLHAMDYSWLEQSGDAQKNDLRKGAN